MVKAVEYVNFAGELGATLACRKIHGASLRHAGSCGRVREGRRHARPAVPLRLLSHAATEICTETMLWSRPKRRRWPSEENL